MLLRERDENPMVVVPLCFSPRIFELWRRSPVGSQDKRRDSPCTDCMPSYQLRMKKCGRCEHPEVMFTIDADGAVVGHR